MVKYPKIGREGKVKMAENDMFHVEQFKFGCVFHVKQKSRKNPQKHRKTGYFWHFLGKNQYREIIFRSFRM